MILNKNKDSIPSDAVYIGRGSKWGNPFHLGVDGTRTEVIFKYEEYLKTRKDLVDDIDELAGKTLACFCKPLACHGDILVKVLTMSPDQRNMWINNLNRWNDFYERD